MSEHTPEGFEDFDAFWETRNRRRKAVKIMGELVELPAALPLQFELEARKLQRSKREKDVQKLVGILFGADQLDRWIKAGMDVEQFTVLLAWAPMVVSGRDVTLAEVADMVAAKDTEGDEQGEG